MSEDECARCSRWQPLAAAVAIPMHYVQGAILTEHVVDTTLPLPTPAELAHGMLRMLLVLTAAIFIAIGVTMLTTPASVVFTVMMWLCAAMFVGLAVFGRFPE